MVRGGVVAHKLVNERSSKDEEISRDRWLCFVFLPDFLHVFGSGSVQ